MDTIKFLAEISREFLKIHKIYKIKMKKELNLDAIHDTVHEMCKDEARHGAGFAGLFKRYFA